LTEPTFSIKDDENFDVHADIPRVYSGPIVLGWPPNKNRSLSLYIQPNDNSTLLLFPSIERRKNCSILIVVHNVPGKSLKSFLYLKSLKNVGNT
jgi:hypothetical protein